MESNFNERKLPAEVAIPLITEVKIDELAEKPRLPDDVDQQILRYKVIEHKREIGRLVQDLDGAYAEIERLQGRTSFLKSKLKEKDRAIKGYRRIVETMRKDFNSTTLHDIYLWVLYRPGIRFISDRWLKRKMSKMEQDFTSKLP